MQKYSDIVLFNGQPLSGAAVTVSTYPSGAAATIYIDNGVTQGPNPIITDLNGRYSFYAANGRYSLQISYPNALTQTILDFPLEDDPANANNGISVLTFGAVADGTSGTPTDNTAAFNRAFSSGRSILIPAGTYAVQSLTIPSNIVITGEGQTKTIIVPFPGTAASTLFAGVGVSNVELAEIGFNVSKATYPSLFPVYFSGSNNIHLRDIQMPNGGFEGIYTLNCTDVIVERCTVNNCAGNSIHHDGASSARTKTVECYSSNLGGATHSFQVSGGSYHEFINCYATQSTTFGFNCFQSSYVKFVGNTTFNTHHEGINATDSSDVLIADNILTWDTTTSQDFGCSVAGDAATGSNFITIRGNTVVNAGKSGIALASEAVGVNVTTCIIEGNLMQNCNRLNLGVTNGGGAGVILYGSSCTNNLVVDNKIYDNIGFLQYGVFEWNAPTVGQATGNKVYANDITNAALAKTSLTTGSYEALTTIDPVAYTPGISAGSGTLTTASATGWYVPMGKFVFVHIQATITTNGTGASNITVTLPFTSVNNGVQTCMGRESVNSGKTVYGNVVANSQNMTCFFYDGTYPAANGSVISMNGLYQRA